eukprot:4350546-Alexandrium_andersonii.AAC.1
MSVDSLLFRTRAVRPQASFARLGACRSGILWGFVLCGNRDATEARRSVAGGTLAGSRGPQVAWAEGLFAAG